MIKRAGLALLGLAAAAGWLAAAEIQTPAKIVSVRVVSASQALKPGATCPIELELTITPPYHINAEVPSEDYLIGTSVAFAAKPGVTFSQPAFPRAETKRLSFSVNPLAVYAGTVKVTAGLTLDKNFKGTEVAVEGTVSYQACNDQSCLPPEDAVFSRIFSVVSGEPGATTAASGREKAKPRPGSAIGPFESAEPYAAVSPEPGARKAAAGNQPPAAAPEKSAPEKLESAAPAAPLKKPAQPFAGKSLPLIFVLVFLGGLGLNLTPCVYPLIPITISYFGGQSGGRKGGVAAHAILYVVGMAATYSILGVAAAFAGSLFGAALQHPPVLIFIALVMVVLALSMFDVYELRLPSFLNRLAGSQQKGYFGTFVMGLTVGIVAAPCIGPFVLGLLTYVGDRGSVILGLSLFFLLALGLGLPFLILGVFSGSLTRLPRSGVWMVWVRKIFGFILIAMAVYFLKPLFPSPLLYGLSLAATMLLAGFYLGWLEPGVVPGKGFRYVRTAIGIVFIAVAVVYAASGIKGYLDEAIVRQMGIAGGQPVAAIAWARYSERIVAEAEAAGLPVFIDSYADWCIPCKEMDVRTFNQPEVIAASRDFVMLKADLTHRYRRVEAFSDKYNIKGVPTFIFLKPDGKEITELRGTGFEEKDVFLKKMKRALELAPGE